MHEEVLSTGDTIILLIIVQVLLPIAPFNKRNRVDFLQGGSSGGAGKSVTRGHRDASDLAEGHLCAGRGLELLDAGQRGGEDSGLHRPG